MQHKRQKQQQKKQFVIKKIFHLLVTLIEVLPKEKKQKEEKVLTYGQAVIDLLQLIKGKTDISVKSTVYPTPGSTLEAQSSDIPLVESIFFKFINLLIFASKLTNRY